MELRASGDDGRGDKETTSLFSRQVGHFLASGYCVLHWSPGWKGGVTSYTQLHTHNPREQPRAKHTKGFS